MRWMTYKTWLMACGSDYYKWVSLWTPSKSDASRFLDYGVTNCCCLEWCLDYIWYSSDCEPALIWYTYTSSRWWQLWALWPSDVRLQYFSVHPAGPSVESQATMCKISIHIIFLSDQRCFCVKYKMNELKNLTDGLQQWLSWIGEAV